MTRLICTFLLLLGPALPAAADDIAVGEGLILRIDVPAGWTLYREAPAALIEETAEHVAHEAEAAGKHPSAEQIRQVAAKRLAANEAILYHPASGSHLDIDFSPLKDNESPPSRTGLKNSARYAGQSLESEEGVSAVETRVVPTEVAGSEEAYRLEAEYRHHDQPVTFIGIIGYSQRHWYFLYFTAPGQHTMALQEIEQILDSMKIRPAGS